MEIIFSGGSHNGVFALRSIQKTFDRVYILRDNQPEILALKRGCDELIENFDSGPSPFVFLAGHGPLITQEQLASKTFINVHGALLPKYRGLHASFWAIMNEEKELGITFHLVNEYMDAGDILTQYSFPYHGQTIKEINESIDNLMYKHAGNDVLSFAQGEIQPKPQSEEEVLFACKRNLEDCLIDFHWNNKTIHLFFKALTDPYPLPRIILKGITYEVLEYSLIDRKYFSAVGRVLNVDNKGIWIKTAEGFLIVSSVRDTISGAVDDPRKLVKIGYRIQNDIQAK